MNEVRVEPGRPIITSVASRKSAAAELVRELVVLLELDVRTADGLERRRVHRLHRNRGLDREARAREHVDDPAQMLHRVLGVVQRGRLRVAVLLLQRGDVLGDLDVALEDAEVRIAQGDEQQLVLREPLELGLDAIHVELADAGQGRRSPVAEGATVGTAAIRLHDRRDVRSAERLEQAEQVRRRDGVEIGDAFAILGVDDAVRATKAQSGDIVERREVAEVVGVERVEERGKGGFALAANRDVDVRVRDEVVLAVLLRTSVCSARRGS